MKTLRSLSPFLPLLVGLIIGLIGMAAVSACRVPKPDTLPGKVISCATEEVSRSWPTALPAVNSCLTRQPGEDWTGCLDLISASGKISVNVVACVLRNQSGSFASAAESNPDDVRSARAAARAEQYMRAKGFVFADGS